MTRIQLAVTAVLSLSAWAQIAAPQADYARDVEPLFRARCYACHGRAMQMNGLRLDRRAEALVGSHSGAVIKPGDAAGSPLVERIVSSKEGYRMPPTGPGLSPEETAIIRSWIAAGAVWPETAPKAAAEPDTHWSFRPIRRPEVPRVKNWEAVRNPIDAFVLAKLEAEGVAASLETSRRTLIRRASLDITGLPPTPEQVAEFLSDHRPGAYERLVDRLLASPHYGEKWARQWLDLAHYADSDGYEKDKVRPWAWRYREWVIGALNRDLPYDRFTIEQIAGDLLPGASVEQRLATGFFRNTLTNREAGTDRAEARFEQIVNRTNTYGTTWLGLTAGCAQCHNHKFDPLSQQEYYRLYAFFDSAMELTIDAPMPGELGPYLRALPEYERKRAALLAEYDVPALQTEWEGYMLGALDHPGESHEWDFQVTEIKANLDHAERILRTPPEQRTARQQRDLTDRFISVPGPAINRDQATLERLKEELRQKLDALDAGFPGVAQAMALVPDPQYEKTNIRVGGAWDRLGLEVTPGTPAVLPELDGTTRLDLARWTASKENPLTARVAVNRIWQELFGRGLVFTSDDFGKQGEAPSHPGLLDWLAAEFMEDGWSRKRLIRTIVTSATYRQSSHARADLAEKDPDNRLLARQNRLRLSAELIRDSALAASGLLASTIGGRSVRPPQPQGVAELGYSVGNTKWVESTGGDRYRRGLYIHFQRTTPYPQLMNFDEPDSNVSCTRRERSNTPLQALNLLNDPVFFEAAQALAWRTGRISGDFNGRLERTFQLCLARSPSENEKRHLRDFYDRQHTILAQEDAGGIDAWVGLSRVVLNMDEFITRE